jgi:hypothetical protein
MTLINEVTKGQDRTRQTSLKILTDEIMDEHHKQKKQSVRMYNWDRTTQKDDKK